MTPIFKLIALVPVAIGLSLLLKISLPEPLTDQAAADYMWSYKTHGEDKFDLLVIGDSRVYRGVSADTVVADLEGWNGMNLGYSSTGLDSFYLDFAASKLKPKGKRIIIVGLSPYAFSYDAVGNWHYKQVRDESWSTTYKHIHLYPYMKYVNPYSPTEIADYLRGIKNRPKYYQTPKPDGWVKSDKRPADQENGLWAYEQNYKNNEKAVVSESIIAAFMQKVKQWTKEGIHVIGFRPPTTRIMVEIEDKYSKFDHMKVRNAFIESGGLWIDFNSKDFYSYDGSHLQYQSAIKLSKELGNYIKENIKN